MMLLVLSWMLALQPQAAWLSEYWEEAVAISVASEARPLFRGDEVASGAERTAAVLVAVAFEESRFRANATGDHGQSRSAWQVSRYWGEPVTIDGQALLALDLMRESFRVCRARPVEERLSWYAAGGSGCDRGHAASVRRMRLAERLLASLGRRHDA